MQGPECNGIGAGDHSQLYVIGTKGMQGYHTDLAQLQDVAGGSRSSTALTKGMQGREDSVRPVRGLHWVAAKRKGWGRWLPTEVLDERHNQRHGEADGRKVEETSPRMVIW